MTGTIPDSGRFVLDPARSSVTFATRHMFGTGKVTGSFALRGGQITIADPVTASTVRAEVDAGSVDTANKARDKAVRKPNLLHTDSHPTMIFESTAVRGNENTWTVTGLLTVRGQSAPVELTVDDASTTDGTLRLRATGTVDRYAHGITSSKGVIARNLGIELSVVATPAAP
jgi:polyisoprenoid-binding protein YceI